MSIWQPDIGRGTWHPRGRRFLGPVRVEQRDRGIPTGLFYVVSRRHFWWISLLKYAQRVPLIRRPARYMWRRIVVKYEWGWLPSGQRAQA